MELDAQRRCLSILRRAERCLGYLRVQNPSAGAERRLSQNTLARYMTRPRSVRADSTFEVCILSCAFTLVPDLVLEALALFIMSNQPEAPDSSSHAVSIVEYCPWNISCDRSRRVIITLQEGLEPSYREAQQPPRTGSSGKDGIRLSVKSMCSLSS